MSIQQAALWLQSLRRKPPKPTFEQHVDRVEAILPDLARYFGLTEAEVRRQYWAPFPNIKPPADAP